jgi:hypothetical protein
MIWSSSSSSSSFPTADGNAPLIMLHDEHVSSGVQGKQAEATIVCENAVKGRLQVRYFGCCGWNCTAVS